MKLIALLILILPVAGIAEPREVEKRSISANLNVISIGDGAYVVDQKEIKYTINGNTGSYQANSLLVRKGEQVTIVDAMARDEDARHLIKWMRKEFGAFKGRVINTHFHGDSTASNDIFKKAGFAIYASEATDSILKIMGDNEVRPTNTFPLASNFTLKDTNEAIKLVYPGKTHAPDNIVVYFPERKLLYGSCLIKTGNWLGNMRDADIIQWRSAMQNVKKLKVNTVVPGHSLDFSPNAIDNTVALLDQALAKDKINTVRPSLAVTIDDFRIQDAPIMTADQKNDAILTALKKHKVQSALFVTGSNIRTKKMQQRLQKWDTAGHMLANHTETHPNYNKTAFKDFSQDITKVESRLEKYGNFQRYFRFPMLKAGDTMEKRDKIRAFLKQRKYKNGYVTIDASDWYIDSRLLKALSKNPKTDLTPYKNYYLNHMWNNANYYDDLAARVVGRRIKHTLLIHHNLINALFLGDLLAMFKARGWNVIDAEDAFKDPIFNRQPDVLPAGESIVWSLAKADPRFAKETRYPAESAKYEKPKMDKLKL